ncbi:MAG: hypothetical protein ACLUTZ_09635 [Oliverpabstia sp.]
MRCWEMCILAEPGALIGFAGPRVIAQTIGQKLAGGAFRRQNSWWNKESSMGCG